MSNHHYQPGERHASELYPGYVSVDNGHDYTLMGFDANSYALKPQHRRFLSDIMARYHLNLGTAGAQVDRLVGYTDAVSAERAQSDQSLRLMRANEVARVLTADYGALGRHICSPSAALLGSYLTTNDTPEGRACNRAVTMRLVSISGRTLPPAPVPPPHVPARPVVYAYKMRLTYAISALFGDGMAFDIVDLTTRQIAVYDVRGLHAPLPGTPFSVTGRGPWNRFTRRTHESVSQFGGLLMFGGVGAGGPVIGNVGFTTITLPFAPGGFLGFANFGTGDSVGAGLSAGSGYMTLSYPPMDARSAPWPHNVDMREFH